MLANFYGWNTIYIVLYYGENFGFVKDADKAIALQ